MRRASAVVRPTRASATQLALARAALQPNTRKRVSSITALPAGTCTWTRVHAPLSRLPRSPLKTSGEPSGQPPARRGSRHRALTASE